MQRKIRQVGVLGSGVMGGGIAALLAGAGVKTLLLDIVPFDLKEEEKNDPIARNRLVKAGLVRSIRGPKGGFETGKSGKDITLLDLYEIFEGPLTGSTCLFEKPVCGLTNCVIGSLLNRVNTLVVDYMTNTSLSEVAMLYTEGKRK